MGKKSIVKDVTYGVCGSLVDLIIWYVALVGASIGKTGPRGVHEAFREADEILQNVNHHTLAVTWHKLTKKHLVSYKKRNNLYYPEITKFAEERLKETFPHYHKNRPWDRRIYLITYDIPEKAHTKRDLLRQFLIKINCKLLQESTWLTPYNPRQLTDKFIKDYKVPGTIIVSDVGSDGGIGEITIQDLLTKVYSLEDINDNYEKFMHDAKVKNLPIKNLLFRYLAILKTDPQLPFELLPHRWLGEKAHVLYKKLQGEYILSYQRPRKK